MSLIVVETNKESTRLEKLGFEIKVVKSNDRLGDVTSNGRGPLYL
jgi:hypothetical protein